MRKIRWGVLGTAHIADGQTIPGMQNTKTANYTQLPAVAWKKQKNFKTGFILKKPTEAMTNY